MGERYNYNPNAVNELNRLELELEISVTPATPCRDNLTSNYPDFWKNANNRHAERKLSILRLKYIVFFISIDCQEIIYLKNGRFQARHHKIRRFCAL